MKKITDSELLRNYFADNSNLLEGGIDPIEVFENLRTGEISLLYNLYETVLTKELHLAGDFEKRLEDLISLDYELKSEKEKDVEVVKTILKKLNIDDLISTLAKGIFYGFSPISIAWKNRVPVSWKPIPLEHLFIDDGDGDSRTVFTQDIDGNRVDIKEDDYRFLVYKHGKQDIEKLGIARSLLYYVALKHFFQNNFANATNEWGLPKLVGYTSDCTDPTDSTCLENKAINILNMLLENGIGVVQRNLSGEKDEFVILDPQNIDPSKLVELNTYFDKNISNMVLGFNLGSDSGKSGSMALAQVQKEAKNPKVKRDSINISQTLQQLVDWICEAQGLSEVNFVFAKEKESVEQFLKNANELYKIGYRPQQEVIRNRVGYDIEPTSTNLTPPEKSQTNSIELRNFEEENLDQIGTFEESTSFDEIQLEIEQIVKDLLQNTSSKDELIEEMIVKFGEIEMPKFEEKLTNALAGSVAEAETSWSE
jgi:phage gp29-like protein